MSVQAADPLPRLGRRIALRRLRLADLERFQAYRCDPDIGRFQGWTSRSDADAAEFLAEMSRAPFCPVGQWFQLGIANRLTDLLLGDVGICVRGPEDSHAEIGFTLAAAAQGQGLGSEAVLAALAMLFECTDVARVIAITDARNQASVRLLRRVGMQLTGSVDRVFRGEECREHVFVAGRQAWRHLAAPAQ